MVDGLVVFDHLDQVLGLTWLMGACVCVTVLFIKLFLWVMGCSECMIFLHRVVFCSTADPLMFVCTVKELAIEMHLQGG